MLVVVVEQVVVLDQLRQEAAATAAVAEQQVTPGQFLAQTVSGVAVKAEMVLMLPVVQVPELAALAEVVLL
jgi:hypothetical protein